MTPRISVKTWKCFVDLQSFLRNCSWTPEHLGQYAPIAPFIQGSFPWTSQPLDQNDSLFLLLKMWRLWKYFTKSAFPITIKGANPVPSFSPRIQGDPKEGFFPWWPGIPSTHSLSRLVTHPSGPYPLLLHMARPSGKWSFIIRVLIFKISLCIRWP